HIKAGDFYEINLAQAFVAEDVSITPQAVFKRLMEISPVPFGAYIRFGEKHLICASPERFLQRQGNTLRSQPIKGTAPRSQDPQEDELHATYLRESLKERAENVMIVDLTRNDLNRSCDPFSVQVPHLFEIQAFPQVYQMVSTVEGQKRPEVSNADIWANTFPPGSMTGAPKVKTMEMIDYYEPIARGVYAGSAGYIKPNGDFDWNVIIRSLVYDAETKRLCYHVGGAITYDSDPAAEYAETLLKAKAIRKIWA
ncbi:MAG: anthranilate synthase component I family protein, partial [Bacteroidota bacterium]